jgi:type VI secretion system protein ImpG
VKIAANLKRVEGIVDVASSPSDRLVAGSLMRGREIALSARQDHFAGMGDLFVFGSVLDEFFSQYSSMNAFTRLKIKDLISGETLTWPERIGDRPLI